MCSVYSESEEHVEFGLEKGDNCVGRKDWSEGSVTYTSTSNILIAYMRERDNMWTVRRRIALDLWSRCKTFSRDLDDFFQDWEQCGHSDFQSSKNTAPGYSLIITGTEGSTLYVYRGSSLYVLHLEKTKNMFANALNLEEISVSPSSVFSDMATRNLLAPDGKGHMTSGTTSASSRIRLLEKMMT